MSEIILGFGSNVGNRAEQIQDAISRLVDLGLRCEDISHCYESKAVELKDQPDFVNAVGKFSCEGCSPFGILRLISRVESEMGRVRTVEKGPRNIDIDLLFFGKSQIETVNLTVPHASFLNRRFVLEPLCELMPDFEPPGARGKTIADLLGECEDEESSPVRMEEKCQIPERGARL